MKSRVTNPERITKKKTTQNHLKARFQGILSCFFVCNDVPWQGQGSSLQTLPVRGVFGDNVRADVPWQGTQAFSAGT